MQDSYPSSRASVPGQQEQPASPGGRQPQLETLKTLNPRAGGFLRRTMAPMCSHFSDGRAQLCLVHLAVRPPTPRLQLILYMQVLAHVGAGADTETRSGPAGFHCRGTVAAPAAKRSLISSDFSESIDNTVPLHSCSPPNKSTRRSQVVLLDERPHDPGIPLAWTGGTTHYGGRLSHDLHTNLEQPNQPRPTLTQARSESQDRGRNTHLPCP